MIATIKKYFPTQLKRYVKQFGCNIYDSFRYYSRSAKGFFSVQSPVTGKISSVVFICKGNVCRSVFAEQRLLNLLGSSQVQVVSCGIDVNQGNFPPKDAIGVADEFSCLLDGRRAKGLDSCDIAGADLICPMEYWQYKRLMALYPKKKKNILLLRNLAPLPYRLFCNIADPYGCELVEYRRVFRLIDRSLEKIMRWC